MVQLASKNAKPLTAEELAAQREHDEYFMRVALSQAHLARSLGEIPVGAVLVDEQGNIVGTGCNRTLTNADPSCHAEIMALRDAGQKLQAMRLVNLTMYVTLEPCIMCTGALIHSRIKRLVFGAYDYKTGACGSMFNTLQDRRHNHYIEKTGGVLLSECAKVLQDFFKERRAAQKAAQKARKAALRQQQEQAQQALLQEEDFPQVQPEPEQEPEKVSADSQMQPAEQHQRMKLY